MNLYTFEMGYTFATLQDRPNVNAWGHYTVLGTVFDTVTGTVTPDRVATCNLPATVLEIVATVGAQVGYGSLVNGATL